MSVCPYCKLTYGRTYEEHTGNAKHRAAIWRQTRGDERPLNCCGGTGGHLRSCETLR